jgi:hypothetical protein
MNELLCELLGYDVTWYRVSEDNILYVKCHCTLKLLKISFQK